MGSRCWFLVSAGNTHRCNRLTRSAHLLDDRGIVFVDEFVRDRLSPSDDYAAARIPQIPVGEPWSLKVSITRYRTCRKVMSEALQLCVFLVRVEICRCLFAVSTADAFAPWALVVTLSQAITAALGREPCLWHSKGEVIGWKRQIHTYTSRNLTVVAFQSGETAGWNTAKRNCVGETGAMLSFMLAFSFRGFNLFQIIRAA